MRVGVWVGLRLGVAATFAVAVGRRVGATLAVAPIFAVTVGARVGARLGEASRFIVTVGIRVGARETMLAPLPPAAAIVGGAVFAGEHAGGGTLAAMHKESSCRAAGLHAAPASLPQQIGAVAKPRLAHVVAQ